ncbi:hypothetical protein ASD89_16035 [Caulobacter sp. Root656]|nr:hypothetical protein ASD89_16035 [Caulobacter sp. Root656]
MVAASVVSALFDVVMVRPIHLDNQSSAEADEVRIIPQQRRLPPEVKAVRLQRPEPHPEANLLHAHYFP